MNVMVYLSGVLEQKMMDEWAQLPTEGRPVFRDWSRLRMMVILEKHYGIA